jgi:beta-lactamase superfamily II metal-dependent hydrolase
MHIDFWDVGQADCSVLTLPNRELILIDVGNKGSPLVDWLNERREAPIIRAIALTHNHADHAGALCSIIAQHKQRISAVWMLADRDVSDFRQNAIFRCAEEAEQQGHFAIQTLTVGQTIWQDATLGLSLRVIHPSFSAFVNAATPNSASAIICLQSDKDRLVAWPGDLDIAPVAEKCSALPPWLLFGPHHGAPTDIKAQKVKALSAVQRLSPRRSFISVGTFNKHSHPRRIYIRALGSTGCHIVCSQLTQRCETERIRRREDVFKGAGALGLRPPRSGISCRGAWRVYVRHGTLVPDEFDTIHLNRISQLKRPQCLLGRGWRRGRPIPPAVV